MADPTITTTTTPQGLDDALELAEILRPTWGPMSRELHASGALLNEGEEPGAGESPGGEEGKTAAADAKDGDGKDTAGNGGGEALTPEEQAIVKAADNPEAVENLIRREREARKEAERRTTESAAKTKEYEDAEKSDQEKLAEENGTLKTKATEAEAEALRLRVALVKQLPAELIDRLQGSTKEELEADADKLLKLVNQGQGKKTTSLDGGARTPATPEVQPGLGRLAHAYANPDKS